MRVIALEDLKRQRTAGERTLKLPYAINDVQIATPVETKIVNGEMDVFEWPGQRPGLLRKLLMESGRKVQVQGIHGELITTDPNLVNLIQKSVVDQQLGREAVPLVYEPIYRRVEDRNFTEYVDIAPFVGCKVVFLSSMEMEGPNFGTRVFGTKDTVQIVTYKADFQIHEDVIEFDKTWEIDETNRAFGEAYNALLNDIHLSPILDYTYAAKNKTAADATGTTYLEKLRNTIINGLAHAYQDVNSTTGAKRRPTILLIAGQHRWNIEMVMGQMQVGGTIYPAVSGIDTIIYYDGWSTVVGNKTYTYDGVNAGKAYLVDPKKYFIELLKHDLITDAQTGNLHYLIAQEIVSRARRGVVSAPANAVEELTLP